MTTTDLLFRDGRPHTGRVLTNDKGKPYIVRARTCWRCGGAGGADKWAHTGWTCFDCNGSGTRGTESIQLYTAEQVAKLDATAAKRRAKKDAAAAAAAAVLAAEVAARRNAFETAHGALLARADAYAARSEFITDVVSKARASASITDGQVAALEATVAKMAAGDAKRAASDFVGKVGERITINVRVEHVASIATQFGAMYIVAMRDDNGNAIVSKGSWKPRTMVYDRATDRYIIVDETFPIKATVKEHTTYRDERQTVVQRVKEV